MSFTFTPAAFTTQLQRCIDLCAADHHCGTAGIKIVEVQLFDTPYGDGSVASVELRYPHPGDKTMDLIYRDPRPFRSEDLGDFYIQPGRMCGALYGYYDDGSWQIWAD